MAALLTRFDLPCSDPVCKHIFNDHFGAGLGYVNAGPCKKRGCHCQKFRKPEKAEMDRFLGRSPSGKRLRGIPSS